MKRLPILLLTIGLLASCAGTTDPASGGADPASGAAGGADPSSGASGGDSPVSSDMVKPVGGDLRIGKPWFLMGGMLESPTSTPSTLTFDEAEVVGQGPINTYSAAYTATPEGGLEFGEWVGTFMSGPDDENHAAFSELMATLEKVDGYTTVEAGELCLFDGDMNVLTYSAAPVTTEPTIAKATKAMAEDVVGLPEHEAQAAVEGAGLTYRVVMRDGKALAVTDDYRVTRINVAVEDGTVTQATIG